MDLIIGKHVNNIVTDVLSVSTSNQPTNIINTGDHLFILFHFIYSMIQEICNKNSYKRQWSKRCTLHGVTGYNTANVTPELN